MRTVIYRCDLSSGMSNTANNFSTIPHIDFPFTVAPNADAWGEDETYYQQPCPITGTLSEMRVKLADFGPGVGKSWTFSIRKNGASAGGPSVTLSGNNTTGSDLTNTLSVTAGDLIGFMAVPLNSPSNRVTQITLIFTSATDTQSLVLGGGALISNNSKLYDTLLASITASATQANQTTLFPTAGTLKNLYVHSHDAPGGVKAIRCTVYKNGLATTLKANITGANKNGTDLVNSLAVVAGDKFSMELDLQTDGVNGTGITYGLEFETSTAKTGVFATNTSGIPSATVSNYTAITQYASSATWTGIDTNDEKYVVSERSIIKNLYVDANTAPGAGKSRLVAVRVNDSTTLLSTTLADTNTTASNTTNQVVVSAGDSLDIISTPSGTPTSPGRLRIAFVTVSIGGKANDFGNFFEPSGGNSRKLCRV